MYLSKLSKKQKEFFLDMCILLSYVDNDFAKEEKQIIEQLCDEMNIEPRYETTKDLEVILKEFADISSSREKRIVFIELLGIVMADKRIAEEEKEYMEVVLESFDMDRNELNDAFILVKELYEVYEKFAGFLNR